MSALGGVRAWALAAAAGGVVALIAVMFANRSARGAPIQPSLDWIGHSSAAEQGAVAYFD